MIAHTPGPWDWLAIGANASGGHHLYIIDASNRKIAALWGKAEEKEANARLIAAAPDMLAALRAIIDASDKCQGHRNCDHDMTAWTLARAAIAKVDGEAAQDG